MCTAFGEKRVDERHIEASEEKLGSGHFAEVYKALYKNPYGRSVPGLLLPILLTGRKLFVQGVFLATHRIASMNYPLSDHLE